MVKELTEREKLFCTAYVNLNNNASRAMEAVGYKLSTARNRAHLLLNRPEIQAYITRCAENAQAKHNVTFDYKVQVLKRLIEGSFNDQGLISVSHGRMAIGAIAELNKMQGDIAPEKRLNVNVDATIEKLRETRLQYKDY